MHRVKKMGPKFSRTTIPPWGHINSSVWQIELKSSRAGAGTKHGHCETCAKPRTHLTDHSCPL